MPKKKLFINSILLGTISYFLVFGFSLYGDEYINLSVRHVNTFLWLLIAISGSLLLRVKPEQFRQGFLLYSATFLVMLMIIACRITFVALLILVWWYFLLAVWLTVVCMLDLMNRYKERWLDKRVDAMRNRITYVLGDDRESLLFGATWQYVRYVAFMRKHNRTTIRANEINLSLGNSIISVLIWMGFAVVVIFFWKIPTGSLGLVAGGLSAGIGLALKDVINNFIYGIQLMGGRLRVGDWIECEASPLPASPSPSRSATYT